MGMGRRAEALSSAFGWYRCWDEGTGKEVQLILNTDWTSDGKGMDGSGHSVMNRSGHGMNRRFKASHRGGGTNADLFMASKRSGSAKRSQWAKVLTPTVLSHDANPK
jgi:hypothetical protein